MARLNRYRRSRVRSGRRVGKYLALYSFGNSLICCYLWGQAPRRLCGAQGGRVQYRHVPTNTVYTPCISNSRLSG
jgi:hypothetical protein